MVKHTLEYVKMMYVAQALLHHADLEKEPITSSVMDPNTFYDHIQNKKIASRIHGDCLEAFGYELSTF